MEINCSALKGDYNMMYKKNLQENSFLLQDRQGLMFNLSPRLNHGLAVLIEGLLKVSLNPSYEGLIETIQNILRTQLNHDLAGLIVVLLKT